MDETAMVLNLFDSKEKWSAYLELSHMRESLVRELKTRLYNEMCLLAEKNVVNSGWEFNYADKYVGITPLGTSLISIQIEWNFWVEPWYRRGANIWLAWDCVKNQTKVIDYIKSNIHILPLEDYQESHENGWFPFIKQIPPSVFDVKNDITSVEECLYMAKDNAKRLATNIWENVFQPFMNPKISKIFSDAVQGQKK